MKRLLTSCLLAAPVLLALASPLRAENEIYINNNCTHDMEVFLRVNSGSGWSNKGWWLVEGNKKMARLRFRGSPLLHDNNYQLYIYGRLTSDSGQVIAGDFRTNFEGRTYKMRESKAKTDDDNDTNITLSCSDYELGD